MPQARTKLRPLSKKDNAFLDSLLEELKVPNPKLTKLKLRYWFIGFEGYNPIPDADAVKALLPYAPADLDSVQKLSYVKETLIASGTMELSEIFPEICELIDLRRGKLSHQKKEAFLKELKSLSTITLKFQKALNRPNIKAFFENYATKDHYDDLVYPYREKYRICAKSLMQLQVICKRLNGSSRSKHGRPSHGALVNYVTEIAKIYEKLSKKKFTIFRHKDRSRGGQVTANTPGHRFVEKIITWTEQRDFDREAEALVFTKANIYNACEAAQKNLKAEKTRKK